MCYVAFDQAILGMDKTKIEKLKEYFEISVWTPSPFIKNSKVKISPYLEKAKTSSSPYLNKSKPYVNKEIPYIDKAKKKQSHLQKIPWFLF